MEYLCTVTNPSILIVTRKPDMCRYPPFSFTGLFFVFDFRICPLRFTQLFNGPLIACISLKVHVALLYLFHLQSLVYYIKQSQRTRSLMNFKLDARKKTKQKKHLHKIFDPPPQMTCHLLLCFWGQVVILGGVSASEGGDENLISKNRLCCSSVYFFACWAMLCKFIYCCLQLD